MENRHKKEIIFHNNEYYILARSSITESSNRILKYNDLLGIFDRHGFMYPIGLQQQGLYFKESRYLSRMEMYVEEHHPLLLSSVLKENSTALKVDLTLPDIIIDGKRKIASGSVHISQEICLYENSLYNSIQFENFTDENIHFEFQFFWESDFADIFEVRGVPSIQRKIHFDSYERSLIFSYQGLDGIFRYTVITLHQIQNMPFRIQNQSAFFHCSLEPKQKKTILIEVQCLESKKEIKKIQNRNLDLKYISNYIYNKISQRIKKLREETTYIYTSNEQFNNWLYRSLEDIFLLIAESSYGYYPSAGIPWYNTIFGRDGIITALQLLWVNPKIAKGVLKHLSVYQAKEISAFVDSEPGKILHELRKGEFANIQKIPFGRYYGSIDSTPLFIILAGLYYKRTKDVDLIRDIWDSLILAYQWIRQYGDQDGDGFVEYIKKSETGLLQQGWKDSYDSIFYDDGTLVHPPVALVEVQGYVYYAYILLSKLAEVLGFLDISYELKEKAGELKTKFNQFFFDSHKKIFILALDKEKKPCSVRASNIGHCLFTGIIEDSLVPYVRNMLMGADMFTEWGIRTLSSKEKRYNPMSYHNGSIWPHDNALIAKGLSQYNLKKDVLRITRALFEVTRFMELNRLPELYCGFNRVKGYGPVLYPVACLPQAWASGTVFTLIESWLGIHFDQETIYFTNPVLPDFIDELYIHNLYTEFHKKIDLCFRRYKNDVTIEILKNEQNIKIIIEK